MSETTVAAPAPGMPTQFDVKYPEELSRLLIFVKWLLVIPHLFVLYALGVVHTVITLFAFFAILFSTRLSCISSAGRYFAIRQS